MHLVKGYPTRLLPDICFSSPTLTSADQIEPISCFPDSFRKEKVFLSIHGVRCFTALVPSYLTQPNSFAFPGGLLNKHPGNITTLL